ncbi:WAP, Kazal, immunoglobulin, Kunitz and NTR domain-containing protein 2 [Holothuria leucospilota]|uniref:WAP, Kazal, immunoglobulin, Kunitz and NTR domain-containing protein 2 n=1 Tax=Holothuria leucospilota TaxID=206669 RepID=A0A9Q1CB47_HOLLE|nr:WAP, Kazal, immunoglobulin, Kunitz and NTR domain-containing protein 2 [Holothuria leucospilota]
MPAEVGMCRAYMQRWAYNSESGRCETFIYGGCGGNGNNFMTADDCASACATGRY